MRQHCGGSAARSAGPTRSGAILPREKAYSCQAKESSSCRGPHEVGRDLAARKGVLVPGEGIFQLPLQSRIEALERKPGGDVLGLTALCRNDARRQHRSERRHRLERTVGVPELVRLVFQREAVIFAHHVALLVESREDHQVGAVALRLRLGDLERSEVSREGKLRLIGDVLVAKDQNRVLLERRAHPRVCAVVGRNVVDGDSAQFRCKARAQRHHVHRRPPSFV